MSVYKTLKTVKLLLEQHVQHVMMDSNLRPLIVKPALLAVKTVTSNSITPNVMSVMMING